MACDLCILERRTFWLHSDKVCVVCECETCRVPMLVFRRHAQTPSLTEERHAMEVLKLLRLHVQRKQARKYPDHAPWHLRPRG